MRTQTLLYTLLAVASSVCLPAGCQPAGPVYEQPLVQEEAASRNSPVVGLQAPEFSLPDPNGKPVTLASLRGQWIVLYFYPKDDTPGCTCEATEFTDLLGSLKGMNAKVYGVSADTPETHKLFIEKFKLGIELLSDPDKTMMRRYGAWVDYSLGERKFERVIRSSMIIDPNGVIRYHWPEVIPKGHAQRVREKLALLQAGPARRPKPAPVVEP
jgi:peroxiredoxin Q/BCP